MTKFQFELLTQKMADTIGDDVFWSESSDIEGFLCGECKDAIALWVLIGGSYADIVGHIFGVKSIQTIYDVFEDVITWINMSFSCPLVSILLKLKKGYDNENKEMIQESVSILKAMSQDSGVDSDNTFL